MNIEEIKNELKTKSLEEIPLRVTYYARVGADGENPASFLQQQEERLKNAIQGRKNWTFVPGYSDLGTGITTEGRNGYLNLMQDSGKDMFNLVLTTDFDRLVRNHTDVYRCVKELHDNGVVAADILLRFNSLDLIYFVVRDDSIKKFIDEYQNRQVRQQTNKVFEKKPKADRGL